MGDLILKAGDIKLLKPTNILRTSKAAFPKQDSPVNYQYYITMVDKSGDSVKCEYLSTKEPQEEFAMGVWQYIKVNYLSPKQGTPEIVPTEEPQKYPSLVELPATTRGNTNLVDETQKENAAAPNCYSVPASGKAITFAMGYAKDILVAEIAANPRKVTDEDIKRMTSWADIINQGICDRITF